MVRSHDGVEVMSMINLVLVKKGMLSYVQHVRKAGCGFSDHHVLCKVRLLGTWIKRREMVSEAKRIRSGKMR